MKPLLVGIFVGGRGTRMGGAAKGLLLAPDTGEPIVVRLVRLCRDVLPESTIYLVGDTNAYAPLGLPMLLDNPAGIGPLGGLAALLQAALTDDCEAMALAADLPYVTANLIVHLARHAPKASAVAPHVNGFWQPLFARYQPHTCVPATRDQLDLGRHAARGVLEGLGDSAAVLPLTDAERTALRDWDTPEDMLKGISP